MPQAQPPQPQRYPPPPNPQVPAAYGAPVPNMPQPTVPQANIPQPAAWAQPQTFNQNPYPPTRASPSPASIPYAYGQLPANVDPRDPKTQHPIPGSYNRQAFNPKSQTFVPSGGMVAMQPPPNHYGGSSSHHSSPQFNSPHMSYSTFQQPMPQPGFGTGPASYGMARQGSNTSMTQYHPVQPLPLGPPHGPQHMVPNPPTHIPNKPAGPPGTGPTFSHLPTYGNPATLPQKPST